MVTPELVNWYERKTAFLIEKYGPGPRIHYHTGLVDPDVTPAQDAEGLTRQLVDAQERMLDHAASCWNADRNMRGELLDVGCGLGGSALYFAENYGARVTGLTPIPGHLKWVQHFAERAGVSELVSVEEGDAHTVPGEGRFDAAYAFGAVNYFDRYVWFRRLAGLLRASADVFIEDTLYTNPAHAAPFNEYWLSNMGGREEYIDAARAAGFELVRLDDVTREAAAFWRVSVAYSEMLLRDRSLSEKEIEERHRSIAWTTRFYRGYVEGDYQNLLFHFRRK